MAELYIMTLRARSRGSSGHRSPGHHGSTILAGSGRVGSRVSVTDPVFDPVCSFCTRFIVAFVERIRHLGICGIAVVVN